VGTKKLLKNKTFFIKNIIKKQFPHGGWVTVVFACLAGLGASVLTDSRIGFQDSRILL
jgi:hypothetical protein